MDDGVRWVELYRIYQKANTIIYRAHMKDMLDGQEDPLMIDLHRSPPFSVFLDIVNFYQSFRRLELLLSRVYPIPADHTKFFVYELDNLKKSVIE